MVGVDTLAVIARQQTQRSEHLTVVLDAYRGQLFVAEYRIEEAHIAQCLSETQVVGIDDAIRRLPAAGSVTGPGLARIHDRLPVGVCLADDTQSQPTAGTVAELGWEKHVAGQHESLWELIPNYFRRSAAEERFGT